MSTSLSLPIFAVTITLAIFNLSGCNSYAAKAVPKQTSVNRKFHRLSYKIYHVYAKHRFADAIPLYLDAARHARENHEYDFEAKFLLNAGACQLLVFRYQDAMGTMQLAREAADRTNDPDTIANANANIASLYLQMGNFSSATVAGNRALAALREGHPQYSRVLIPIAQVRAEQRDLAGAEQLIRKAIDGAYRVGDLDTASWAWDYLGYKYTQAHRLAEADRALTESLRLRKTFRLLDLGSSFYHLALLRSDQGRVGEASALLDSAIVEIHKLGNSTPAWLIFYARGRLLNKIGDQKGAWENLGKAVELVRDWRTEVVANDANRTSAETALSELYALFIEVGNQYALSRGISLARKTFEAAEENRATGLRALAERETGWHNKLPARYWETLGSLQDVERALLQTDTAGGRAEIASLRNTLDVLEAASGMPANSEFESATEGVQKKLDFSDVLLSFQLGEPSSWLWAITKNSVAVFVLPPRSVIKRDIQEFQQCVHLNKSCMENQGASLYATLFGVLPENIIEKKRWIFSLDQELFSLPIPALVIRRERGNSVYLGAVKALQATPGALMYARSRVRPDFGGALLGLGDAIYNRADARWLAGRAIGESAHVPIGFVSQNDPGRDGYQQPMQFARLWGAAQEVREVAKTWEPPQSTVLTGINASRERLWAEMARGPSIVHFATHILEAQDQLHTGWIALSLTPAGQPEFLSPSEISAHRINTSLVVLNGCNSGMGEIRPASGLMGLTRAWMAAGAADVLATRWPGPDEDGWFFVDFYQNLKQNPQKGPAYALLATCQNSIKHGGWRAKPEFWASYFLTGTD